MPSEEVSGAAKGASTGASVAGPWGAVAGAVIGAFTAGGTYAVTTGKEIDGVISSEGFQGKYYGLAQNAGKKYRDDITAAHGAGNNLVIDSWFNSLFGDNSDVSFPIKFTGSADGETFIQQAKNYITSIYNSNPQKQNTNPQTQNTNLNPTAFNLLSPTREYLPDNTFITPDNRAAWLLLIMFFLISVFVFLRIK